MRRTHSRGGLQFIVDTNESGAIKKSGISSKEVNLSDDPAKRMSTMKTRIHGAYPVGISLTPGNHGL